ncbi:Alpha/Beta hydrolase protein, partial [Flagelloscypha sp. PMI_526]
STTVLPKSQKTDTPLIILHGLFGSKRNWNSTSKSLVERLGRPIHLLDLRNHGKSPHARPMDYLTMASDVSEWIETNVANATSVSLLGHSMGGKVAMSVALSKPNLLSNLIVADIAPSKGNLSKEFQGYIDAMHAVQEAGVKSRKDASDVLTTWEKDQTIQAFLLTNLDIPPGQTAKFRIPIGIIRDEMDSLGDFQFTPGETTFEKPTLFIKGTKSNYINERNLPTAKQFFPNMELEEMNVGHWVHAEDPHTFQELLVEFL